MRSPRPSTTSAIWMRTASAGSGGRNSSISAASSADRPLPSLWMVGLSHMGKGGEKEIVVPSGLEHFVADARRTRRCLQGIDGQLADDGEIFGGMILAAATCVLVEQNVENPVQVV